MPDWLKAAAPPSEAPNAADLARPSAPDISSLPSQDIDKTPVAPETPDWLSALKPVEPEQQSVPTVNLEAPGFKPQEMPQPSEPTPAFTEE